jgi:SAM-dependent methyltransferase
MFHQLKKDEWRRGYINARRNIFFSNNSEYRRRLQKMGVFEISKDARILDFGSGDGAMLMILGMFGYRNVVGLEPDSSLIEKNSATHLVIGRGPDLPFREHTFDVVLSNAVLHHLSDESTICRTILEFRRVLRPGGLFAYIEPSDTFTRRLLTAALIGPLGGISQFSIQKRLMVLNEWDTLTSWLKIEREVPGILGRLKFNVRLVKRGLLKTTVRATAI